MGLLLPVVSHDLGCCAHGCIMVKNGGDQVV